MTVICIYIHVVQKLFKSSLGSSSFAKPGYVEENNIINASSMEKAVLQAQTLNTENLHRRQRLQMSWLGKGFAPGKDFAPY